MAASEDAAWSKPTAKKTLEFRLSPLKLGDGFLFDVAGETATHVAKGAYHLAVLSDGMGGMANGEAAAVA